MNPRQQLEALNEHRKAFINGSSHLQVPGHHGDTGRRHSVSHVRTEDTGHKHDSKANNHKHSDHNGVHHKDRPLTVNPNMGRRKSISLTTGIAERAATSHPRRDRKASVSVKGDNPEHKPLGQSTSWNKPSPNVKESHNITIIIQDGKIVERRKSLPTSDSEDAAQFLAPEGSPKLKKSSRAKSPDSRSPGASPRGSPSKDKKKNSEQRSSSVQPTPTPTHKKRSWSLPGGFGSDQNFLYKTEGTLLTVPSSPTGSQRIRSDSLPKRGKSASLFPEGVKVDFFPDIQPPVFDEYGRAVPSSPLAQSRGVCSRQFDLRQRETTNGGKKETSDLPSPRKMGLPRIRSGDDSPRREVKMDDSNRRHSLFVLNPRNFGKLTRRPSDSLITIDDLRPAAKYEIRATSDVEDRTVSHLPDDWLEEMKKCRYLRMPKELAHRLGYDWD